MTLPFRVACENEQRVPIDPESGLPWDDHKVIRREQARLRGEYVKDGDAGYTYDATYDVYSYLGEYEEDV